MNTYVWKVTSMSTLTSPPAPIDQCAVFACYTVTATNQDNPTLSATIDGFSQFSIPTTDDLTPYAELTEEQVLSWIQAEPNLVINIQANLDGQIASQIAPQIVPAITDLPWA